MQNSSFIPPNREESVPEHSSLLGICRRMLTQTLLFSTIAATSMLAGTNASAQTIL